MPCCNTDILPEVPTTPPPVGIVEPPVSSIGIISDILPPVEEIYIPPRPVEITPEAPIYLQPIPPSADVRDNSDSCYCDNFEPVYSGGGGGGVTFYSPVLDVLDPSINRGGSRNGSVGINEILRFE